MQLIFWIWFGAFIWLLPYFILQRRIKTLQNNQNHWIQTIQRLERSLAEQSIVKPSTAPPNTAAQPSTSTPPPLPSAPVRLDSIDHGHHRGDIQQVATAAKQPLLEPDERSMAVITSVWATLYGWFSGGNSIVRVGVLVLLIGVVLLLRLLGETISLPIQIWLGLIALAAVALSGVGWSLRQTRRGYALSLQGTGLAILYLTLFSAYDRYGLLPSELTFGCLALLAGVTAALSLRQDALPLAVLGFGGAFFAPILTSTEQGQVVGLFTYYLCVNVALAWIAHQRTWKVLNLLGALTTFGAASLWGWQSFDPMIRWPMALLLAAHVALYLFIVVRYSQLLAEQVPEQLAAGHPRAVLVSIDSGLLFGVPLVAFGLQAGLLHDVPYALACSSAVLATLYLGLAYWLKQRRLALPLLREGMLALGLGFLALILPLALNAQWTSTGWLVQGAGLVWVGTRQTRGWQVVFGLGLQVISLLMLVWLWLTTAGQTLWLELAIAFGALLFSAALLGQRMPADTATNTDTERRDNTATRRWASLMFIVLSGTVGVWLLQDRWSALHIAWSGSLPNHSAQIILDLLLLSAAGMVLAIRLKWPEMYAVIRRLSPLLGGMLVVVTWRDAVGQTLIPMSLLGATLVWLGVQLWLWRQLARYDAGLSQRWDQAIGLVLLLVLLSVWSVAFYPNTVAVALLPIALLWVVNAAFFGQYCPQWLQLQHSQRDLFGVLALGFGGWIVWANLQSSGQFWPLPYIPVLNLLDGCLIAVMVWLYRYWPTPNSTHGLWAARLGLGGLAFWSLSGMVVRGLHQWLATPLWPDAWSSDTVQSSLTIVWSGVALLMTVLASRRAWRELWWIGLGLLAVVIAKLMLVDLSNLSATARVISFIGAGGLMLVIGYVAPLPPEAQRVSTTPPSDA